MLPRLPSVLNAPIRSQNARNAFERFQNVSRRPTKLPNVPIVKARFSQNHHFSKRIDFVSVLAPFLFNFYLFWFHFPIPFRHRFLHRFLKRFCIDFGCLFAPFWIRFGAILAIQNRPWRSCRFWEPF